MVVGDNVTPWTRHVAARRDLVRRAFDAANEIGDLTYAAYSCNHLITNLLAAGDQLMEVQREAENGLEFAQKVRFGLVIGQLTAQLRLVRTLRGLTPKFGSFNDEEFDELRFEHHLTNNPALAEVECWFLIRKLQACFFAGNYASAVDASSRAQRVLWTSPSQFETAELHLYGALSHAASWDCATPDRRQQHFEALTAHHRQLEVWAENCAENFENRAALVGAEIARVEGRNVDAEHLYERAIRSAHANGFVHNEAVANELAFRFYRARGFDKIADMYLRDARDCYLQWGADGKVRQLDMLYPHLRDKKPLPDPTNTILTPTENLDLATVLKLLRAISGEIVFERLIDTLMRTAIENAGAERGLLILARGDEYRTVAEATAGSDTVAVGPRQTSVTVTDLPESVLHYVARTKDSVLLHDASSEKQFLADEYIHRHHARSILCLPLLKETRLVGMLYLENNLAPHVFTPDRIVILKLLASLAAISLENIRAEAEARESEQRYREVQMELAHANRVATMGQLSASIAHEINQPIAAAVTYADAALRWLGAYPPNLEEVREALGLILESGVRAGEVMDRIRALVKKAPPQKDSLRINDVILEVIALTSRELEKNGILAQTQLAQSLPEIQGDRVQLQQVVLNLLINAIEAISGMSEGPRELLISTAKTDPGVLISVRDSGPGLTPESVERLFESFYTTKPGGLGMGLSICRSIIEAHGGRLWASANEPRGAVFQFTLTA
jgi:signal transduction histidine kinase